MSDREDMVLAPCPFCGGSAELSEKRPKRRTYVICTACDTCTRIRESANAAAEHWNTRSAARTGPDVVVKPLRWDKNPDDEEWYSIDEGHYQCCDYIVYHSRVSTTAWCLKVRGHLLEEDFDSAESAKAAAQADYKQRIRSAIAALPAPGGKEVTEEQIAREICLSYGRDPDEPSDIMEMCDANDRPVPTWRIYEEQARALLSTYKITKRSAT